MPRRKKAENMAHGSYFAHGGPDGKSAWAWLIDVGYRYKEAGENLAVQYVDSFDVVSAWMNSQTHRENLLRNSFTEIGVGQAIGVYKGRPALFTVSFFAKM